MKPQKKARICNMCCLFGFYYYGGGKIDHLSRLTNLLAENAAVRGTDAAGDIGAPFLNICVLTV